MSVVAVVWEGGNHDDDDGGGDEPVAVAPTTNFDRARAIATLLDSSSLAAPVVEFPSVMPKLVGIFDRGDDRDIEPNCLSLLDQYSIASLT